MSLLGRWAPAVPGPLAVSCLPEWPRPSEQAAGRQGSGQRRERVAAGPVLGAAGCAPGRRLLAGALYSDCRALRLETLFSVLRARLLNQASSKTSPPSRATCSLWPIRLRAKAAILS